MGVGYGMSVGCIAAAMVFAVGCGKNDGDPVKVLGVYSKDSLAVRHILDANGLSSQVVG